MNFISGLALGLIAGIIVEMIVQSLFIFTHRYIKESPIVRVKGRHLHHSIYGVVLLIFFIFTLIPFLLGAGVGIIAMHTYREKKFAIID